MGISSAHLKHLANVLKTVSRVGRRIVNLLSEVETPYGRFTLRIPYVADLVIRSRALSGHVVELVDSIVYVYSLDTPRKLVCHAEIGIGDVHGDCGSILDPDSLAEFIVNLANGYFTLAVAAVAYMPVVDGDITRAIDELARIGASMDSEIYDKILQLFNTMKVRIYRGPVGVSIPTTACWAQLDGVQLSFSPVSNETAVRLIATFTDALGLHLHVVIDYFVTDSEPRVVVRPIPDRAPPGTGVTDEQLNRLVATASGWREAVINALRELAKHGRCSRYTNAWIRIIESLGEEIYSVP